MTLVEVRFDTQFEHLADLFKCGKTTAQNVFNKWIDLIYTKVNYLTIILEIKSSIFIKHYFPRLTTIIDFTEFTSLLKLFQSKISHCSQSIIPKYNFSYAV